MSASTAILITLLTYNALLIAIGLWASRRTQNRDDFFLGGRRMGGLVAAISASASSSSAWTLLGVSGMAFAIGWPALWLFPATLSGFLINWCLIAPRLRVLSGASGAVTLTEFMAGPSGTAHFSAIVRLATGIILFSFIFYVASQFQAAGEALAGTFGLDSTAAIATGAAIILAYTWLGGFWAVSMTDTLQGLLMALTALVLPLAALAAVGGPAALLTGMAAEAAPAPLHAGVAAVGFAAGTLGIGLGYPGQPHVLNRFMALRNHAALRRARVIAIAWAAVVYAGMLLLGFCGRVMFADSDPGEAVFFSVTTQVFPPVLAGITIAAVLSAIMSTADSQLLVAASSVAHDWRLAGGRLSSPGLRLSRQVVAVLCVLATALALAAPEQIFTRVLFAWHAVGSAFGPVVLAAIFGMVVRPGARLAAMAAGFFGTVVLHWMPDTPGDWAERLLPLLAAAVIVILGREVRHAVVRAPG